MLEDSWEIKKYVKCSETLFGTEEREKNTRPVSRTEIYIACPQFEDVTFKVPEIKEKFLILLLFFVVIVS